jgi:hypothetical protein
VREIAPKHESVRPDNESRYNEIRHILGRPPDLARLSRSETVQEQIAAQKVLEDSGYGHVFKEHRVTTDELRQRAADGTCARDNEKRYRPKDATGFRSDEAAVAAVAVGWSQPETIRQRTEAERQYNAARARGVPQHKLMTMLDQDMAIRHSFPIERALGTDWRTQVEGYTKASEGQQDSDFGDGTKIKIVWKMSPEGNWYVETCYPKP